MHWAQLMSTERLRDGGTIPDGGDSNRRNSFQRDYDRIVYSTPFRRLQNKTQVHTLPNNDHVRNRLTHSLEASTLARSLATGAGKWIAEQDDSLISPEELGSCAAAATLAHDIGNPPFGHPGEAAIQEWFAEEKQRPNALALSDAEVRDFTKFNGNAQGLRILTQHQHGYDSPGLQLTCATLAAFAKYPISSSVDNAKGDIGVFADDEAVFGLVAKRTGLTSIAPGTWARHPLAFLVEAADDIAYLTADIEDGVELGMIPRDMARTLFRDLIGGAISLPANVSVPRLRAILIGVLIEHSLNEFKRDYDCIMSGQRTDALLKSHPARDRLKELAREKIFASVLQIRRDIAGREAIDGLLKRLARTVCDFKKNNWSLPELRKKAANKWRLLRLIESSGAEGTCLSTLESTTTDAAVLHRIVDYVAGATDRYAIELWQNVRGIDL